ncbi:predicted protein [Phaeodactylum tricornutum CCAP 1055/1]|uniref:Redoxin domain-containing protein n=1 Tax=Phaeodactylum tricornutum (strain CCAP 1055/1) TaxID=556484 RepID=B7GEN8_PHATC|nr:predicted protein [Phaeodactylum tricornutum CCAP 1055/1]EEC42926.1 predicted protein [Phaeodactylum tricornutum CCAP 1055/1]|eukprot:XP_002185561.1 predicted protein [Phaeodactylum tricornutum CCAP 1055/1]
MVPHGSASQNDWSVVDWSRIPPPVDDGGTDHLQPGLVLPSLPQGTHLVSTDGARIDPSRLPGRTVLYAFPITGRPDQDLPRGWDMIPGARGCTPQSCAFRDHFRELQTLRVQHIFGVSTQTPEYQTKAVARLHLPFSLLSDQDLVCANLWKLPTVQVEGRTLLQRVTLIIDDGVVKAKFYPIFPPNQNALRVIQWLTHEE